jgi:hypothetical protein
MVSWARAQQKVGECNVPSSAGLARQEPEAESDAVSGSESDSEPGASADAGAEADAGAPTAEALLLVQFHWVLSQAVVIEGRGRWSSQGW